MKSFTDLRAWRQSHALVLEIYKITSSFPGRENYSLVDQIRRAAVSITSNLAEGFNRPSNKDKARFYYMSLGSLAELQNQLLISRDVKYLDKNKFDLLASKTVEISKLINGLIKSLRT